MNVAKRKSLDPRRMRLLFAAVILVVTGCTDNAPPRQPSGGATPAPTVTVTREAVTSLGAGVRTGILVGETELVIYFWGSTPYLDSDWLRPGTSEFLDWPMPDGAVVSGTRETFAEGDIRESAFISLRQLVIPGYPVIEFGAIRATPSRILIEAGVHYAEATFTTWSHDQQVTIFWAQRAGEPLPDNTPAGEGRWEPLPPENYPLVTAYDGTGGVIDSARIRPPAGEQKGG